MKESTDFLSSYFIKSFLIFLTLKFIDFIINLIYLRKFKKQSKYKAINYFINQNHKNRNSKINIDGVSANKLKVKKIFDKLV